ncbi:amidohydrolase [Alteromonas sp. D210916BOD_24]|uniref:amidohydrolase family protein n=1 Tax=Alteromonas sp. D210916BOD_24 TaxID=3157618 RepID=UPI00399D38F5
MTAHTDNALATTAANLARWIDPHIHLFALSEGEYKWLEPQRAPFWRDKADIAKDVTEHTLIRGAQGALTGFVHIEAGYDNHRPWREIHFLERHCRLPFRSIACVDITANSARAHIDLLAGFQSVCGVRHILDEQACAILGTPKAQWSLSHLSALGLSFEAQLNLADNAAVGALLGVIERNPTLRVALNHAAIAPLEISSLSFKRWRQHIRDLSESAQVVFKFSGLEMQQRQWSWQRARFVFDELLTLVSVPEVMFASNFPLSNWRMPYRALWDGYYQLSHSMDRAQQQALMLTNAKDWYWR